ncbi:hypothetical protein JCM10914A_44410 [Paenibacillus sp. JCM 10914]
MDMRKSTGWLIVIVGVLLLIFTLNPTKYFSGIQLGNILNMEEINDEEVFPAEDFQQLQLHTGSTNVNVIQGNSDQIKVSLQGKASTNLAEQIKLKAEPRGDTLVLGVDYPQGINLGVQIRNVEMILEMPEKQWKTAVIESGSGNIDIAQLLGDQIEVKASSGNVRLTHVSGDKLQVYTGSGNMSIEEIRAESIMLKAGSGNIRAEQYTAASLSFQNGSGNVELDSGASELQGKSGSGDILIVTEDLAHNTDIQAGSGKVTIDLVQMPSSLEVDYQGGSGRGSVEWDGFQSEVNDQNGKRLKGMFGAGEALLKVRTGSGNFTLK